MPWFAAENVCLTQYSSLHMILNKRIRFFKAFENLLVVAVTYKRNCATLKTWEESDLRIIGTVQRRNRGGGVGWEGGYSASLIAISPLKDVAKTNLLHMYVLVDIIRYKLHQRRKTSAKAKQTASETVSDIRETIQPTITNILMP